MMYMPKQRDIVWIDFDPSKGREIKKRRPALIISSDNYNLSTNLIIVCPITTTKKQMPFLIPAENKELSNDSKINTKQVFSLDYTNQGERSIAFIAKLSEEKFLLAAQMFMYNFSFPFFQ